MTEARKSGVRTSEVGKAAGLLCGRSRRIAGAVTPGELATLLVWSLRDVGVEIDLTAGERLEAVRSMVASCDAEARRGMTSGVPGIDAGLVEAPRELPGEAE